MDGVAVELPDAEEEEGAAEVGPVVRGQRREHAAVHHGEEEEHRQPGDLPMATECTSNTS